MESEADSNRDSPLGLREIATNFGYFEILEEKKKGADLENTKANFGANNASGNGNGKERAEFRSLHKSSQPNPTHWLPGHGEMPSPLRPPMPAFHTHWRVKSRPEKSRPEGQWRARMETLPGESLYVCIRVREDVAEESWKRKGTVGKARRGKTLGKGNVCGTLASQPVCISAEAKCKELKCGSRRWTKEPKTQGKFSEKTPRDPKFQTEKKRVSIESVLEIWAHTA
ncbi:hypothetical protein DdX_10621 [Ditylenchus destructor]|uniref:Uncharacterized protein n=1 Tax=Ditylenchus destructor TaxID=166010 RepID=A0AAD4MXM5_9BILA|nr:hypothetical protein DdX_10621 [Ditylenchus destructor]